MNTTAHSVDRQLIFAVSGLLGVLLVAASWGAVAWIANTHLQGQLETKTHALDDLKAQVEAIHSKGSFVPVSTRVSIIGAPTETIAASDLHKKLLASVQQAGGSVHSIQVEITNDSTGSDLRRITALVAFDGSIDALQRALFALETAIPFIFVDAMTVQPAQTSSASGKIGETVRVTLRASSYWKSAETKANP
jgi:type II secretion system (T2SS) protein M